MRIAEVRLCPYALPLAAPIRTATTTMARRRGTLVWLRSDEGISGVGDAAAWPGFGAGEASLAAALAALAEALVGWDVEALLPVDGARLPPPPTATPWPSEVVFALESAALDAWGQAHAGASLATLWDVPAPAVVHTHRQVDNGYVAHLAQRAGFGALKVKIGARPPDEELLRVGAIRQAVGSGVALRLDANGAWSAERAGHLARHLAAFSPAWIEQPVPAGDVAGLAHVRRHGGVPVAADEAVTGLPALRAILAAGAADVVVLKPMYVGGLATARQMARLADKAGVQVVVTHALESAVGRMAARHLAAALAGDGVHGLGDCLARDVGRAPEAPPGMSPSACPVISGRHWGIEGIKAGQ